MLKKIYKILIFTKILLNKFIRRVGSIKEKVKNHEICQ
jgi:hypothetical protein